MKKILIPLATVILFSCSRPTPETVLGLKLGLPFGGQVKTLIEQKQLLLDGDKPYIQYSGYRGYLNTSGGALNDKNEEPLQSVTIYFLNNNLSTDRIRPMVADFDTVKIIKEYIETYGAPTIKQVNYLTERIWEKGGMQITLVTEDENKKDNGINFCKAMVIYEYSESIKQKIQGENKKKTV